MMGKRRRFSKILSAMLVTVMGITAVVPALAQEVEYEQNPSLKAETSVGGEVYPYIRDFSQGEYDESEVTLYYVEDGDIPYVSLPEFMSLYSEFMVKALKSEAIEYQVISDGEHQYRVTRADRDSTMWIDTEADTIVFNDMNAFMQAPNVTASVAILDLPEPQQMDFFEMMQQMEGLPEEEKATFMEGLMDSGNQPESLFATAFKTINRAGDYVELNLADYLIDLVEQEGVCYVPLQTLNDLLVSRKYFNLMFNGIALYLVPYGNQILDELYKAESQEMSQEFALFNYNELRFMLDCNYGLKPEHNISDFGSLLAQNTNLVEKLISTDSNDFDDALAQILMTYFDDGHSALSRASWRSTTKPNLLRYLGLNSTQNSNLSEIYRAARSQAFPEGVPMYQEVGDTAFITFDSFIASEDHSVYYHMDEIDPSEFIIPIEDAVSEALNEESEEAGEEESAAASMSMQGADTIKLLYYAYQQITREGSPIRNVVLDLSNNGGGMADAAVYVVSWLLGSADIAIRDTLSGAETIMRLTADLFFDEQYSAASACMLQEGYQVYCLTSINSFSCGNLVPAMCKLSEMVTLIGKTSGGGSCVVLPCTSASGAVFTISGPMQLSTIRNGSFYNIDQGIEPDVVLTKPESFYDREDLVEMIHTMR